MPPGKRKALIESMCWLGVLLSSYCFPEHRGWVRESENRMYINVEGMHCCDYGLRNEPTIEHKSIILVVQTYLWNAKNNRNTQRK
uniref:Putative secreted protein n=1 Tax=Anopheles marajoara TaxID=58244 RepID=A0A2M4CBX7_9DIPT